MSQESGTNNHVLVEVKIYLEEEEWLLVEKLNIKPCLAAFHSVRALESIYSQSPDE